MESLKEDLKNARKENEALRFMLEVTTRKCKMLGAQLKEKISLLKAQNNNNDNNNMVENNYKRSRIDDDDDLNIPISTKTRQVFVRTDPKDKSLVSTITLTCSK